MIVWLASYPKSGNTWIRIFLSTLLYSPAKPKVDINKTYIKQFPIRSDFNNLTNKLMDLDEFAKNCIPAQKKLNQDNKIKFLKTHNAYWQNYEKNFFFTDEQNSLGAIHIVRDPRNVITSVMDYFNKDNYNETLEFLTDNYKVVGGTNFESGVPTILLSWANHYNSWKNFKKNYLLIKYENLINKPQEEFLKITNYLSKIGNFKFNEKEVLEIVENCKFENFSNQEKNEGFIDNSATNKNFKKKFFRMGPKNNWEDLVNSEIISKIETHFKKEMIELNYL
tara:strand:+ start:411 stop:1250 length:840 start_codon:yes stop_codon:yes gene_type:complete